MDVYPPQYVEHNLPFVVLSGLGDAPSDDSGYEPHPLLKDRGIEIDSAVPVVTGERVDQLRQEFLSADAREAPWNGLRTRTRGDHVGFRLKAVGRGYVLPPRKAQVPQISPDETPPGTPVLGSGHRWVLHSPISPLSPGSPTFPDGVMSPLWIAKHQNHIPSVFISFFDFTSEPGRDTLNDNQLKAEINRIKAIFHSSGYKTHYAVVLMSDRSIFEAPDIEERLANIRRTTGLDPKNALFFLPANPSHMGKELIHAERYSDALSALKPLWEELHSRLLRPKQGKTYDLMNCLDSFPRAEGAEKLHVTLRARDFMSCLSITAEFAVVEGHVAEPILTQIAVRSYAHRGSKPIVLDNLTVTFRGSLGSIKLQHQPNESGPSPFTDLTVTEDEAHKAGNIPSFKGSADLSFSAGEVRVFTFPITFREAGEVFVESAAFEIDTDRFHLTCTAESPQDNTEPLWWYRGKRGLKTKRLGRIMDDPAIKVLPKPPKMEVRLPNLQKRYYATETVILELEIENGEDEEAEATLDFVLMDQQKNPFEFSWLTSDDDAASDEQRPDPSGHRMGKMEPGAKRTQGVRFAAPVDSGEVLFEAKVVYHVISDPDVPISKTIVGELAVIDPFEATYDFTPQVHPDPWPSFFHIDDTQMPEASADAATAKAFGLTARYLMNVRVGSYAEEDLVIQDADLTVHEVAGGAMARVTKKAGDEPEAEIAPQVVQLRTFCVDVQKTALEDRRSSALATSISVTWRRKTAMSQHADAAGSVRSVIANPRLIAANSEPRVLASARASAQVPTLIHLDYTLENPTMHFLTFDVSMEASEEFAFAGPKLTALHVLPHSRQTVRYNVLPLVKGAWIYPQLRVQDRYFNKVLKPAPTEGMRQDKRGIAVWADVVDEEGGEKLSRLHFLAGLSSGVLSAVLLQPADLLKTRVQQSRSTTLSTTLSNILRGPDPVRSLWRGTVPSALRTGFGSALYFTTLNALRTSVARSEGALLNHHHHDRNPNPTTTTQHVVGAGGGAGNSSSSSSSSSSSLVKLSRLGNLVTGAVARASAGLVMMPVTVIKVRFESSYYAYPSLWAAVADIRRAHGARGFFAGFGATAVRDAPYAGLYVLFYEESKKALGALAGVATTTAANNGGGGGGGGGGGDVTMGGGEAAAVNFASGVVAAGAGTALTNPFDAIKTRLQLLPDRYANMAHAARLMLREEGVGSLFDGLGLRMARKALSSALAWTLYEELIRRAERRFVASEEAVMKG
ncbi:putative protein of unknown function DUF1683 [Diplodia seriata]|uniref:Mitochondrial glycine transporter n=1 Tax=Diplodia seriata TaxID=420778 RepID=A0A0G2DWW1_9PEZI|nr:putative protein of unknown function DUF1683 [Diplodia seriata]